MRRSEVHSTTGEPAVDKEPMKNHFSVNEEITEPDVKATVQDVLASERKFWLPYVVEGGSQTLLHLESTGDLRQPYPGLFWRGVNTRFGMANPPLELLISVLLPKGGWGYTTYSGANMLGLSTQIPKLSHIATPYIPPHGAPQWVEFLHRPELAGRARHKLSKYEVTLLEVITNLTSGNRYIEHSYDEAIDIIKEGLKMRTEVGIAVIPRLISGSLSEPIEVRKVLKEIIFH